MPKGDCTYIISKLCFEVCVPYFVTAGVYALKHDGFERHKARRLLRRCSGKIQINISCGLRSPHPN